MAIIDPRLLPLIETLSGVGADWLAFELVDGVQRGREPEESEDALASARAQVRSGEPRRRDLASATQFVTPILGDDQIVWAATYVSHRLDAALDDLAGASEALNAIAAGPSSQRDLDREQPLQGPPPPITIVIDDEEVRAVSRNDSEEARSAMEGLRSAIEDWSREVRTQSAV